MTIICNFNHEGWEIFLHYHLNRLFIYIEDDLFSEAILAGEIYENKDRIYVDKIERDFKVVSFFEDAESLYSELEFQHHYNLGVNYNFETLALKLYERDVALKIIKTFYATMKKYKTDYEDNFRMAEKGNIEQENIYNKNMKRGCCGSVDEEVVINNKVYLIGFNYGH